MVAILSLPVNIFSDYDWTLCLNIFQSAEVTDENGDQVEASVEDNDDGTYRISFTAKSVGTHCLNIQIFDRPIKDSPLYFDVTEHNAPLLSFGSRGTSEANFVQPCSLILDADDNLYVVDTGNSRIKVLSKNLDFRNHIFNENLEGRSVTGVCLGSSGDTLVTVNWRTKTITEMNLDGRTIGGKLGSTFKYFLTWHFRIFSRRSDRAHFGGG